jgi:hypothetical protein
MRPPQDANPGVAALAAWNTIALQATLTGPFSPPQETRSMAMMSIAVFNAVNAITRVFESSGEKIPADRSASIPAAIAAASHRVLSALYPKARAALQASYDSSIARIAAGPQREAGISAGLAAANAVIAMRSNDGAFDKVSHTSGSGAGAWVTTPPPHLAALEPGWGRVKPFALDSGSQFRPQPPPRLGSDVYVRDYAEVVTLGGASSTRRTPDQADVASFWGATTAVQLWDKAVRQLTVERKMEVTAAARAYLLVNVAGADAIIGAWEAKYAYGQWRPVTAIRSRLDDGSTSTQPDTAWVPFLVTPPFPDYPAGHTAFAGAAEYVLITIFGDKPGSITIAGFAGGQARRYASFSQIAQEVVDARVWAGVHWRTSSTAGREMGRAIGARAMAMAPKAMTP